MKFVLVNVHLPHSGRPLEDLHRACDSLIACLMPVVEKGLPMVLLGDLDYDVHRDDPSSECDLQYAGNVALDDCSSVYSAHMEDQNH